MAKDAPHQRDTGTGCCPATGGVAHLGTAALAVFVLLRAAPCAASAAGAEALFHETSESLNQTDVFVSGEEGYHTYRIPAIVVSRKGTLLAFCEGRKHSRADDGDIDIVLKRSHDNGKTWGKMQVVRDDGSNTIGNPCPVVDRETGTIWLPFTRNNERVFVTKSTDDGATWENPVEITKDVKLPSWNWYATGPTHGIQLRNGRLLIPCDHKEPDSPGHPYHSHVIYSDDHGSTWKLGGVLGEKTNECVAVETADGSIYLNMRSYHEKNRRAFAWSKDGGDTWSEVKLNETLVEPVCQASMVRFTLRSAGHSKNRVLFSNPASTKREKMTVRVSYDECQSWKAGKALSDGPSAYSDLCIAPDMSICCLYERGEKHPYERITFARFTLEWLTDGADKLGPNPAR